MNRLVLWLVRRRSIAALAAAVYFIPNVVCHDLVESLALNLRKILSLPVFNTVITAVALAALGILSIIIFVRIRNGSHKYVKVAYWSLTIGLAALFYNTLIVTNVEVIHYPQFALLALPVFAVTRRIGETVMAVTLLGAIDEAYQYLVLHHKQVTYFDFNDVVLDLAGAAIGVVFLLTFLKAKPRSTYSLRKLCPSRAFLITAGLMLSGLLLYSAGLLHTYPTHGGSRPLILLSKTAQPSGFWRRARGYKSFHVIRPGEGILLIATLMAVFVDMDYRIEFEAAS